MSQIVFIIKYAFDTFILPVSLIFFELVNNFNNLYIKSILYFSKSLEIIFNYLKNKDTSGLNVDTSLFNIINYLFLSFNFDKMNEILDLDLKLENNI